MKRTHAFLFLSFIFILVLACYTACDDRSSSDPLPPETPEQSEDPNPTDVPETEQIDCPQTIEQIDSPACQEVVYGEVDELKICLAGCDGDDNCEEQCWNQWDVIVQVCNIVGSSLENCGDCYSICLDDFTEECILDPSISGKDCMDEFWECADECIELSSWPEKSFSIPFA